MKIGSKIKVTSYSFDVISAKDKLTTNKINLKLLVYIKEFHILDKANKLNLRSLPININNSNTVDERLYSYFYDAYYKKVNYLFIILRIVYLLRHAPLEISQLKILKLHLR